MSYPNCSCYGTNENCRYCYGSGIAKRYEVFRHGGRTHKASIGNLILCSQCKALVKNNNFGKHIMKVHSGNQQSNNQVKPTTEESSVVVFQSTGKQRSDKQVKPSPKDFESKGTNLSSLRRFDKCLYCNELVKSTELDIHVGKFHPNSKGTETVLNTERPIDKQDNIVSNRVYEDYKAYKLYESYQTRTNKTSCPICRVAIKRTRLDWHLRTVHPQSNRRDVHISKFSPNSRGTETVSCHVCRVVIKRTKLDEHLRKVHAQSNRRDVREIIKEEMGRKESLRDNNQANSRENYPQDNERKLDYTKPYAHAYRENGRFGSHPSHDDFGDESNS